MLACILKWAWYGLVGIINNSYCTPVVLSNSDSEPLLNQGALIDMAVDGDNGIGHDLLGATA